MLINNTYSTYYLAEHLNNDVFSIFKYILCNYVTDFKIHCIILEGKILFNL